MRPGNVMTLKIINCYACYDFGEVIDKFDQGKRERCHCQAANDKTNRKKSQVSHYKKWQK
jgi:hypothetical protein